MKTNFCSIFWEPYLNATAEHINSLFDVFKQIKNQHPILVGMDSNLHHQRWGGNSSDNRGEYISDMVDVYEVQLNGITETFFPGIKVSLTFRSPIKKALLFLMTGS